MLFSHVKDCETVKPCYDCVQRVQSAASYRRQISYGVEDSSCAAVFAEQCNTRVSRARGLGTVAAVPHTSLDAFMALRDPEALVQNILVWFQSESRTVTCYVLKCTGWYVNSKSQPRQAPVSFNLGVAGMASLPPLTLSFRSRSCCLPL